LTRYVHGADGAHGVRRAAERHHIGSAGSMRLRRGVEHVVAWV